MRKIYDCIIFFNELDLLEVRLEESYNHVDHFVIVESNKTFQNGDKEFNLEKHWDRYKKYHDKMIYIKVEDMPNDDNPWIREYFQRNAIARGIVDANDNDIIVVSDCDEILRASTFDRMRNDMQHSLWICRLPIFWVKLNYWQSSPRGYNVSSMATTKSAFPGGQTLRDWRQWAANSLPELYDDGRAVIVHHAGWHFTYLGDTEQAKLKLESFAHAECRYLTETVDVEAHISKNLNPIDPRDASKFLLVRMDDYFPKSILDNPELWKDRVIESTNPSIRDLLPKYV